MSGKQQLYQAITLIVVVLFFHFLERRRPGFQVHRQRDLPLNVLALIIVIVAGEMWKTILVKGLDAFRLDRIIFLDGLHGLASAVKIISGIILADFCLYWIHRAMHRPGLWRTHTFHHSIGEIWWLSGSRTSLMHLFLFALPQVLLAYGLLELAPWEAGVAFSFGVVVNIWIHTNLWVNLGPLEKILISPNYHRIHHGARGLSGKNLGFVLTLWDRMFRTYVNPRSLGKDFALGSVPTHKRLLRMIVGL
jgi:sterol desaturase/sphingolipid hydroxylase (fatty acid hydroxylase superfamily)